MEKFELKKIIVPHGTIVRTEIPSSSKNKPNNMVKVLLNERDRFVYEKSSCTCYNFVITLQSKENREKKKICKHIRAVLKELENGGKLNVVQ